MILLYKQGLFFLFFSSLGPGGADLASASEVHYHRGEGVHCM